MRDEELDRIRHKKLEDLIRRGLGENTKQVSEPVEVTDLTFGEFIRSAPLVVIDCWAPWCAPCRFLSPILEDLARTYAGQILFGKLNVDENQKTSLQYGVMSIPTLLVFKDGNLVDRIVGAMPKKMLEQKLIHHL
ncbi:MAG: thioredoxin [Candidatus Bathyarchaeia archaeon]